MERWVDFRMGLEMERFEDGERCERCGEVDGLVLEDEDEEMGRGRRNCSIVRFEG